jgi:hypothetical protein
VFTIFRPGKLPEPERFIAQWQELASRNGLGGFHFVAHLFDNELDLPWRAQGYGGAVVTNELKLMRRRLWQVAAERWRRSQLSGEDQLGIRSRAHALAGSARLLAHRAQQRLRAWPGGVHFYEDAVLFFKSEAGLAQGCYPSIVPGWDNTPRAGPKGIVLHGANPAAFGRHVRVTLAAVANRPAEERLVFVKSWNEWAEGNYLEPDRKFGHGFLDALRAEVVRPGSPVAA